MGKGDSQRPVDRAKFSRGFDRVFRDVEPPARTGNWIQTHTNNRFWPLSPRAVDIDIEDVAHALSNVCRYGGHCSAFYSVAQHSVHVSENVPPEYALWGLLHDASEAYIGDMISPLKHDKVWARSFRSAEDTLMQAVVERFGLSPSSMPPEVARADKILLLTEIRDLMGSLNQEWGVGRYPDLPVLPTPIVPWSSYYSKYLFLRRFKELTANA